MREPDFWWKTPGLAAALLSPFSAIYGAVAAQRMRRPGAAAGLPVICVGNLTVGGAGKTPAALTIARLLTEAGQHVFFLSRGYGGDFDGPVRVDPARHTAFEVGDEPLLLAAAAPTIVARDRVAGARMARDLGATVVVMDDGFQNSSLRKDLALIVLDGRRGIGNGRVIPAGPLRAPIETQFDLADALLIVGSPSAAAMPALTAAAAHGIPVFHGRLQPDAENVAKLRGRRVLAFAGIGDPEKFFRTVTESGIDAPVTVGFPDHHRYSATEIEDLHAQAARENLLLLTTEKDRARMTRNENVALIAGDVHTLPVTLVIEEEQSLRRRLLTKLG